MKGQEKSPQALRVDTGITSDVSRERETVILSRLEIKTLKERKEDYNAS